MDLEIKPRSVWLQNLFYREDHILHCRPYPEIHTRMCYTGCVPGSSDGEESACNVGDLGVIPGLGRPPREGNSYPPHYSCLENSMHRGAWQATVHGTAKSKTQLSDFHFLSLLCYTFSWNPSLYSIPSFSGPVNFRFVIPEEWGMLLEWGGRFPPFLSGNMILSSMCEISHL